MIELFTVTYTLPCKGTFTERSLTKEGVRSLMNAIIRKGGWGCSQKQS